MPIADSTQSLPSATGRSPLPGAESPPWMELEKAGLCSCTKRWSLASSERSYGPISFFDTTKVHYDHDRMCPFYLGCQKKTRGTGIRFSYSSYYLSGIIQAALVMTTGSGGYSRSPTLTFHATVPRNGPAFTLVRSLISSDEAGATMPVQRDILSPDVSSTLMHLRKLFQSGKASPWDRTVEGDTLLTVLASPAVVVCG